MSTFPPLYVLRHGETEWNASGRLQGSFDSALTERGQAQARTQRQILLGRDLKGFAASCSPQGRAIQTANIALEGLGLTSVQDDRLREIGLGAWAGLDRETLMAQHEVADGFELYQMAPGGEGFKALHSRCIAFLEALQVPSVVITHGITSRMIRSIVTNQPISALREMAGGQGVVFHLEDSIQNRLTLGA